MSALCPPKNKPDADLVYTPRPLAKQIIEHYDPMGFIIDPCKGDGAFYDQFTKAHMKNWYEISKGRDFLAGFGVARCDWIVTNPPWSKFVDFLAASMSVANNVVFLVTINHYMTKKRLGMIEDANFGFCEILMVDTPPAPWPQSGFQLAAVHLKRDWIGECKFSSLQKVSA